LLSVINRGSSSFSSLSLERRFTLLRASNGSPLSLEDMKNKFAIQRAKNAEFTISEDEELVILDQLQRIQENSPTTPLHNPDHLASPSSSMFSSQSRSPTSPTRRARQYGGGLFSSSQSTDTRLFRKMARTGSDRSLVSKTSGESFMKHVELIPSSPRPIRTEEIPQATTSSNNGAGYISDKTPIARQLNLQPSTSPPPTLRHDRNRSQADIARISMALSNVMKEIEEEGILDPDFKFSTIRSRDDRPSEDPQGSSVGFFFVTFYHYNLISLCTGPRQRHRLPKAIH
jgi:serine/arginine repetitive matrix protein 2